METIKKLIDLPVSTAKGLLLLAAQEGLQTKPYMEKILIEHEANKNRKGTQNYKSLNPKKQSIK